MHAYRLVCAGLAGLAGTPDAGKLHHHLGLLSRDKDGSEEELRGVYHFIKRCVP